jgi:hypothetical protein
LSDLIFYLKSKEVRLMFTFLLITSLSKKIEIRKLIANLGTVRPESGGRFVACGPAGMQQGWIAVQRLQDAEKDFEPEEADKVGRFIRDPFFILVEGRDGNFKFSDEFILGLEHPDTFAIDNDHGLIDSADKIQNMIRGGQRWLDVSS